jgi:hypothetical protein
MLVIKIFLRNYSKLGSCFPIGGRGGAGVQGGKSPKGGKIKKKKKKKISATDFKSLSQIKANSINVTFFFNLYVLFGAVIVTTRPGHPKPSYATGSFPSV